MSLLQPGYLGSPATYQGSTVTGAQTNAAQLDPNLVNSLGSGATIQQLLAGFQPQAQNSDNQLNQTLADFGVTGGQAVGAMTQLQGQLGAALAPSIASAIQNSQANTLNAGEFNTGNTQQANLANQASTNTADLANQGSTNQANQYNATAENATNAANVGQFNQSQNEQLNALLQQYYAQLGAFNNINNSGQGAANQNAVNFGNDITVSDPFADVFGPLVGAGATLGAKAVK